MIVTLFLIIILCIPGLRVRKKDDMDYLNKNTTSSLTGVFVICIFMSHILGIMGSTKIYDIVATYFFQSIISQMMVVPFFFFSGYGIISQYFRCGRRYYLSNFLLQRFLKIYLTYLVCEIVGYTVLSASSGFKSFGFTWMVLTIWNTHWFVFVILALYVLTFIALLCFKDKKILICISLFVFSIGLAALFYFFGKGQHWYNTIIAFPIGVLVGCYKTKLDQFLASKQKRTIVFVMAASILIYIGTVLSLRFIPFVSANIIIYLLFYYLRTFAFIVGIIAFSYLFVFGNKILSSISKYGLYCYILQWFTFRLFKDIFDLLSINIYLYFVVVLLSTILISFVVGFLFNLLFRITIGKIKFNGDANNSNYEQTNVNAGS